MTDPETTPGAEPLLKAGNSKVQQDAEQEILAKTAVRLGVPGLSPGPVALAAGPTVEVDGVDPARTTFVEAFARQGALKGGQRKKVAQDILKLSLIKADHPTARAVIAFACPDARKSITGWVAHAAAKHGIELIVVDLEPETRERILAAQKRQYR